MSRALSTLAARGGRRQITRAPIASAAATAAGFRPPATHGAWNGAHFDNPTYDSLFTQYIAAVDLQSQRSIAGKIERLLLAQTPIIIPYWIGGLAATTAQVQGVLPNALGAIFLGGAYKKA